MSTKSITAAALSLTPEEKAKLAEDLLRSLDPPDQADIEDAWAEEIERRIDALDRGEEDTIPVEQFLSEARARLNERH
jgi:putative addiction module component (TIGR02574 family)